MVIYRPYTDLSSRTHCNITRKIVFDSRQYLSGACSQISDFLHAAIFVKPVEQFWSVKYTQSRLYEPQFFRLRLLTTFDHSSSFRRLSHVVLELLRYFDFIAILIIYRPGL